MSLPINRPNLESDPAGDLAFLEEEQRKQKAEQVTKKLAKHINKVWQKNQRDFKPVRKQMVEVLRRVKGEYDPQKAVAIKAFGGSDAYVRSSEAKSRAAVSWIKDIYGSLPWSIDPTAEPTLPDETVEKITMETRQEAMMLEQQMTEAGLPIDPVKVAGLISDYYDQKLDEAKQDMMLDAKKRCKRAQTKIKDQNQEGGWNDAFKDFLYYFVRLKFGVIKGPVLTKKKKQVWQPSETGGYELTTIETVANDVYCVSPFNFYPSKGIKTVDDGDIIEIHELTKQSISELIGIPGYDEEELRAVLAKYEKGEIKSKWLTIEDELLIKQATTLKEATSTNPPTSNADSDDVETIYAQEFYGTVSGKLLIEWGMEAELDPHMQYQVNCWKIGDHVIKAVLNPDNLGRKPYHVSSWAKNPEWIVGEGLIEFAGPVEDAMNAVVRALVNNIAIASGPMAEEDKDRIDGDTPIYPWRRIRSTSTQMKNDGPAVVYYQPQMHAQELISAYQFFSKLLDEMTVPAYAQGASQSGVTAGTATVYTSLLAAASRSIKAVVANIDDDIIKPYFQMCYDYNMKFSDDPEIKGDAQIVAKGISALLVKEQQAQRKVEYLQIIANPAYMQILGQENIASVLSQIAKANDIELPDMDRLDGNKNAEAELMQIINSQAGVDINQELGQTTQGGGAPAKPQGTNPNGDKAGVNNG